MASVLLNQIDPQAAKSVEESELKMRREGESREVLVEAASLVDDLDIDTAAPTEKSLSHQKTGTPQTGSGSLFIKKVREAMKENAPDWDKAGGLVLQEAKPLLSSGVADKEVKNRLLKLFEAQIASSNAREKTLADRKQDVIDMRLPQFSKWFGIQQQMELYCLVEQSTLSWLFDR